MFPRYERLSRLILALTIETLSRIEVEKIGISSALAGAIRFLDVDDYNAISATNRLVRETLRRQNLLDKIIHSILGPDFLEDIDVGALSFLRVYTFQVKLGNASEYVPTIVRLGRQVLGWERMAPIEEALGKILGLSAKPICSGVSDEECVALKTFHPAWFVRYCTHLLGRSEALRLLRKNMEIPSVYIRLNSLGGDEREILKSICSQHVDIEPVANLHHLYRVTKTQVPLSRLEACHESFLVQDKSSCLAVETCGLKPGLTVLDVCAGPGIKTTNIAQLMENRGSIYSIDYLDNRMNQLEKIVGRMGARIVNPIIADARNPLPLNLKADVVLLDPPCSNTGVFWKNPSAKWRVEPHLLYRLTTAQYLMLENCADYVKLGGILVYSTCSVLIEENEMVTERFLKRNPNFALAKAEPSIGIPAMRGQDDAQRLYPHLHDSNGSYVAKIVKSSE